MTGHRTGEGLLVAGIDEAGYGPRVGPLAVGMSALRVRQAPEGADPFDVPDLWRLLRPVVVKDPPTGGAAMSGHIAINDSKRLKRANTSERPLLHLERGVLAVLGLLGRPAPDTAGLLGALGASVEGAVWGAGAGAGDEPAGVEPDAARILTNLLRRRMDAAGVEAVDLRCAMLTEGQFNGALREAGNKAGVSFALVSEHLRRVWDLAEGGDAAVVVDRQGGRVRYGRELAHALGVAVTAVTEGEEESVYHAQDARRRVRVRFAVEAEGKCLATALASMAAKLCRERAMEMFNAHFRVVAPRVRPTAGYGTDGRRWIEEMRAAAGESAVASVVRRA